MTPSDRLTTGAGSEVPSRTDAPAATLPARPSSPFSPSLRANSWEDLFRGLSKAQQIELLDLAGRQGVIYEHQLPLERNGARADPGDYPLDRFLNCPPGDLEPLRPVDVQFSDEALDPQQCQAVARALATPDLLLLRGLPGTGKSRVVAEILVQAACRGQRVLLLGQSAAAIDRVLEAVGGREGIYAIRCLGPGEMPETLAPSIRALTVAGQRQHWSEQALPRALADAETRDEDLLRLRQDEAVWPLLLELGEHHTSLAAQLDALGEARAKTRPEVERLAVAAEAEADSHSEGAFRSEFAAFLQRGRAAEQAIEEALADRRRVSLQLQQELAASLARRAALLHLTHTRNARQWWRWAWWQALFHRGLASELAMRAEQIRETEQAVGKLNQEIRHWTGEREQAGKVSETGRNDRINAEITRRDRLLDEEEQRLHNELKDLDEECRSAVNRLAPRSPRPKACTHDAVHAACAAWRDQVLEAQRTAEFGRHWVEQLKGVDAASFSFGEYANVVATTIGACAPEQQVALEIGSRPFDFLILQEADQITEADFQWIARFAPRRILVGEPAWERKNSQTGHDVATLPAVRPRSSASAQTQSARPGLFHSLWNHLRFDAKRPSYAWTTLGRGLCCRFQQVLPDQRQWLETERVADCPDIELRILAESYGSSSLAEILFPSTYSISRAKSYVYRELQELAAAPAGQFLSWTDEAEKIVLRVEDASAGDVTACMLEPGITEYVTPAAPSAGNGQNYSQWQTVSWEFARTAGWDRRRAEEWVARYLGAHDPGRTIHLSVSHRMDPELAAVVSSLLFAAAYRCSNSAAQPVTNGRRNPSNGDDSRVEFIPIPPLAPALLAKTKNSVGRKGPAPAPTAAVLPGAGAGLELNLADVRHCERLPLELRPIGVSEGFANFGEAQAVVRALEALAVGPRLPRHGEPAGEHSNKQRIAVMALYSGQVELIRRLVQQSPALQKCCLELEIGLPTAFRERECPTVFVSLTRSHPHRAVSFGEGPHLLALALTRARSKLVIFGDPGSLARRSQWTGHVDHLDESAAEREHEVVTRLVDYLRGQGSHPHAFHLREGLAS